MVDIVGDDMPTDSRKIWSWIKDFGASLSLDLVGSDFLEFTLKGSEAKGLGKQLEAVTSRFLEVLLSMPDALDASYVLLNRRKEDLEAAEHKYLLFKAEVEQRLQPAYRADVTALGDQQRRLKEKKLEFEAVGIELDKLRTREDSSNASSYEPAKVGAFEMRVRVSEVGPDTPEVVASDASPLERQLVGTKARYVSLQDEVRLLTRSAEALQSKVDAYTSADHKLRTMVIEIDLARKAFEDYSSRYGSPPASLRGPGILNAPERIKLIDPPRDPVSPTRSARMVVLFSAAVSVLMGVGLVFLVEGLDPTVRRADEVEDITGVPVLAELP
jgi:hypothetical protein